MKNLLVLTSFFIILILYSFTMSTYVIKFKSGFENTSELIDEDVATQHFDIIGNDFADGVSFDWEEDFNNNLTSDFDLRYLDLNNDVSNYDTRSAEIVTDPTNPDNKVLEFRLVEANQYNEAGNPVKGRVSSNIKCFGPTTTLPLNEFNLKVKVYFPESIQNLQSAPNNFTFFTLFELWNNGWSNDDRFRITLNLRKYNSGQIKWRVTSGINNSNIPHEFQIHGPQVPFNEWLELNISCIEGDENNGKLKIYYVREDGTLVVICNETLNTKHPWPNRPVNGFENINPMKLYTGVENISYANSVEEPLNIYWDDFEFVASD